MCPKNEINIVRVCFNIMNIKQVLPEIVSQPNLRKFISTRNATTRVLTLCHLLDNLSTPKKCAQVLEKCISAVRLLKVLGRNKGLGYVQANSSNSFDNKILSRLLPKAVLLM